MPTPVFVNPPPSHFQFVDKKYHNHDPQQYDHLFLSSHNLPPCDPTFFNTTHQDQRSIQHQASQQHQLKVHQHLSHHSSSDEQGLSPSSSHRPDIYNGNQSACKREVIGDGSSKSENGSATKWMSSKMRLMQKMTNSNCIGTKESKKIKQQLQYEGSNEINSFNNNKNTVRVCSDCNTTTTPLWRSGPRGPKSLCNACGIRQRKVRKAMEAVAGNGTTAVTTDTGCTKIKIQHNKQKKSRTSHVVQHKKQCKPQDHPPTDRMISRRNLCFNDFALGLSKNSTALKQVFPQDVKDAAILLMELSCGFIQR